MTRRTSLSATLVVVVLLAAASGGNGGGYPLVNTRAEARPPGVSALSYSPKPYFKDMTEMKVRFTTTGPAGPGREYIVWLFTGKNHRDNRCYPEYSWEEGVRGAPGKQYEVAIDTVFSGRDGDALACFGQAQLVVWTQKIDFGHPLDRRVMRKLSFWIHRPRR